MHNVSIFSCVLFVLLCFFFFFSSRRRHTRYWRDWSSDVCSSDLRPLPAARRARVRGRGLPRALLRRHLAALAVVAGAGRRAPGGDVLQELLPRRDRKSVV